MVKYGTCFAILLHVVTTVTVVKSDDNGSDNDEFTRLIGRCSRRSPDFDRCMKGVFNDLRVYFPTGVPKYNIAPFDPHRSPFVEQRRGGFLAGYKLILTDVSEYGWTNSEVRWFKSNFESNEIIYEQYFPLKSLDGKFHSTNTMLNKLVNNSGDWNLTLSDYSQTTTIKRLDGPGSLLKVHVEVDHIGGMSLHISNFFGPNKDALNNLMDALINSTWKLGLPFIKPLINDLVSTAFTDIFNESFRYFPIENFIS